MLVLVLALMLVLVIESEVGDQKAKQSRTVSNFRD